MTSRGNKIECVCLSVCSLFFMPQFRVDLHEIWHVASLCPTADGHRCSERRLSPRARAQRARIGRRN